MIALSVRTFPLGGPSSVWRAVVWWWCSLKSKVLAEFLPLWEAVRMATKRTKADKAQRQADELESKLERRPVQVPKKAAPPRTSARPLPGSSEATKER